MMKPGTNGSTGEISLSVLESIPFSDGSIGSERGNPPCDLKLMYDAATEGNWEAAEELVRGDPSLACRQQITETGDRALHVAISKKHTEMVLKLIELVGPTPSDLELQDGHGYTACCYAAMMGYLLDVAKRILGKNPNLWNAPNKHATTPLQLAVFYGNAEVAMHFLESRRGEGNLLRKEWWFNLLLDSVRSKMYGVAMKILERDESLAGMTNYADETALHILAHLDISSVEDGCECMVSWPQFWKWNGEAREKKGGCFLDHHCSSSSDKDISENAAIEKKRLE